MKWNDAFTARLASYQASLRFELSKPSNLRPKVGELWLIVEVNRRRYSHSISLIFFLI